MPDELLKVARMVLTALYRLLVGGFGDLPLRDPLPAHLHTSEEACNRLLADLYTLEAHQKWPLDLLYSLEDPF